MTEGQAALTGALIGAMAGLAGGAFAAVASIRASQLAARASLAELLHDLYKSRTSEFASVSPSEQDRAVKEFEQQWNRFAVHQRILCPSRTINQLSSLLRTEFDRDDLTPEAKLHLGGQIQEKVARMIGEHSTNLIRWRVCSAERRILKEWLAAEQSSLLSAQARERLTGEVACSLTRLVAFWRRALPPQS